jgi:HPt (histidine-containing phosphotransfer) domain-containing protein
MLIDTTLLVNSPEIITGLLNGSMKRYGSVIRWAAGTENAGQIVRHLAEAPGLTSKLTGAAFPILGNVNTISNGLTYHKLIGIEKTLSSALGFTQIAAGASVLNLGVSIAGFAYMGYKLHQIQNSLGHLQQSMEEGFNRLEAGLDRIDNRIEEGFKQVEVGFNRVNNRLNIISGQLAYLYLLVEDNRQKQQSLAKAISHLHQAMLIKEIAALNAELDERRRFPNESSKESLKVASRVRLFLASQALQATPELDAELMLNTDVSIQGWAVATATEVNLLLEIGQHQEAKELLAIEVPKFQQVAQRWGDELINDKNSYLSTAYRFTNSRFNSYITPERVERIIEISSSDRALSSEQIRQNKTNVDVEFEMSYSSKFDKTWTHRQIAVAEYLDTLSELVARLDSLQSFAALCQSRNVSSRDILPSSDTGVGLYVLSAN